MVRRCPISPNQVARSFGEPIPILNRMQPHGFQGCLENLTNHQVRSVIEWDEQPVFCGIENSAPRNLDELNPIQLSQQFEVFSKGLQQNLVPALSELENPPVLFLAGEKDKKYQQVGDELAELCPVVESRWVEDSGHRVPWENPESFSRILIDFAIG